MNKSLKNYYKTLFPLDLLCLIVTQNNSYSLIQVEMAFDIRSYNNDKIMIRNVNTKTPYRFSNTKDMCRFMIVKRVVALHMGAVFWKPRRLQANMRLEKKK